MYDKVVCQVTEEKIEVEKHYSGRYGAPGMPRAKKKKKTPEEMARQNLWRKTRDLRRMLEANFRGGDWHVVLTCRPEDRPSVEQAPKLIRYFRDKLRKEYKAQGWELKYVITCEIGERGAVHWHMVINNMQNTFCSTASFIRKHWEWGRAHFTPLDDSREYQTLAEYLTKETAKRIESGNTVEKLSYMPSRNLIRPAEKREKVRAKGWKAEPKAPKGWKVENLINGINKYTNRPFQKYVLRKEEADAEGKDLYRYQHPRSAPPGRAGNVHHGS